jgi:hypothetical protein
MMRAHQLEWRDTRPKAVLKQPGRGGKIDHTVSYSTQRNPIMMRRTLVLVLVTMVSALLLYPCGARAQAEGETAGAIPTEETTAQVPELDNLHEVIYQLWHDAYPEKNYTLIKELLPQADDLTTKLDAAALPGILRDKQAQWDTGKVKLTGALAELHKAAALNDEEAMLKQTEAYHAAFEGLVRTIRPVVPALDAFHKELYKLYHYYAPEYDLANIRAQAAAMKEAIPALKESTLTKKLADRQKDFDAAVVSLSSAVDELLATAGTEDKDAILAAVEKVHMAYVSTEKIFG